MADENTINKQITQISEPQNAIDTSKDQDLKTNTSLFSKEELVIIRTVLVEQNVKLKDAPMYIRLVERIDKAIKQS